MLFRVKFCSALRDANSVLAMSCDSSLKKMENLSRQMCLTFASVVKSACLELLMIAFQVEGKCEFYVNFG
jgi:hypothetical protein